MNLKKKLIKINCWLRKIEEWILGILMALMLILLVCNAFGRFVLHESLQFGEEAASLLLVMVSYLGCITAVRKSKHIRMVLLSDRFSFLPAYILTVINQAIPVGVFSYVGYLCTKIMITNYKSGRMFMTFQMGRWLIWVPVVVGLFGTAFQYFLTLTYNIIDFRHMKSKNDIWIGSEIRQGDPAEDY